MLAFVDPETLIPSDHPLRTIKRFADAALVELSPLLDEMYAADGHGRASMPPERLLKASLLISLYSVRSERAFCEELTYHLLFRWFLDMDLLEPSFDHSTFSKNRARLLRHRVSREFFDAVVLQADRLHLLSERAFQCGRHADPSRRPSQELSTHGCTGAAQAPGRWQSEQSLGGLPRPETLECNAPEHDRSRCAAVSQRSRQR